jgi:hypothetical protein
MFSKKAERPISVIAVHSETQSESSHPLDSKCKDTIEDKVLDESVIALQQGHFTQVFSDVDITKV